MQKEEWRNSHNTFEKSGLLPAFFIALASAENCLSGSFMSLSHRGEE